MATQEQLLKELGDNRQSLHGMLDDLKTFRGKLEQLLPKQLDYRNKFMMEEKMKLVTNVISTELSIRKQIDDSLKNEITIRNKVEDTDEGLSRSNLEQIVSALSQQTKTDGE